MLKLLFLIALGVGGYFIVKKIIAEDTDTVEADSYYRPPEPAAPAS